MDEREEFFPARIEIVARDAEDPVKLVRPRAQVLSDIPLPDAEIGDRLGFLQLQIAGTQRLVGFPSLGDVPRHANHDRNFAVRIEPGAPLTFDMPFLALRTQKT